MSDRQPIHLLMRFSDRLGGIDTIASHQAIIEEKGAVWFGKMGKPLALQHLKRIKSQCDGLVPTYLYLVQRIAGKYEVNRGAVLEVSRRTPEGKEFRFVPPYYTNHGIFEYMTLWTKLSEIKSLDVRTLNDLLVSNTLMAVPYTLPRSMAALFIVREGQGMRG